MHCIYFLLGHCSVVLLEVRLGCAGGDKIISPARTFDDNLDPDEPSDEEMPLNETNDIEDPICEGPQAFFHEPKSPQSENAHGDNTLLAPILNTTEGDMEETPLKDPTPVKGTIRKCSTLQPVTLNSHQFLFNTSIVYKNAAGELEIASPPERRPGAINTLDDQLTRVSLYPQREPLDEEFFVAGTPEDKIPRAATATAETSYPQGGTAADTFISPLAASPQVRVATISPILETPDLQKHEATPPYTTRLRPPLPPGRCHEVASTSKGAYETPGNARIPESVPVTLPSSDCIIVAEKKAELNAYVVASQSPPKPKALNFDDFEVGPRERPQNLSPSKEKPQPQQPSHLEPQIRHVRGPEVPQATPTSCHEPSPGIPPTPRDMLPLSKTPSTGQRPRRKFKRLKKARDLVRTTQQEQMSNKKLGGSNQPEDARIPIKKHTRLGTCISHSTSLCACLVKFV